VSERSSKESAFKTLEQAIERMRQDMEQSERCKEQLMRENRRLNDELTVAVKDVHSCRCELELEKQEVENMRRQLQQYVCEVKRVEELLSQKDSERNDMLNQFR
jgi:centrosomal protein CEP135